MIILQDSTGKNVFYFEIVCFYFDLFRRSLSACGAFSIFDKNLLMMSTCLKRLWSDEDLSINLIFIVIVNLENLFDSEIVDKTFRVLLLHQLLIMALWSSRNDQNLSPQSMSNLEMIFDAVSFSRDTWVNFRKNTSRSASLLKLCMWFPSGALNAIQAELFT